MTRRRRLAVAGVAALAVFAVWGWHYLQEKPYHDLVARLRAAGEPVDYEGLAVATAAGEADGGADIAAATQWLTVNLTYDKSSTVVGPWNANCDENWADTSTPEQRTALAQLLADCEPYFAHVRRAAALPRIRFHGDERDVLGFPEPYATPRLLEAVRMFTGAAAGLPDETARLDALATLAVCSLRVECPTSMDHLVASGCSSRVVAELRRQVEEGHVDAAAARTRLDPLLRECWLDRLPAVLRSDRAEMLQMYRTVLDGTWPYGDPTAWERLTHYVKNRKPMDPRLFTFEASRFDAAGVVSYCKAVGAAMAVPPGKYAEYRAALAAAMTATPAPDLGLDPVEQVKRFAWRLCLTDAACRLARVALAAAEHRATRGDFPASLDDLKRAFPGGVPLDPFTDAPFVYERTADGGARIASLGRLTDEPPLDEATLRERVLVWKLPK